ncbi:MAG: sulfatase-like hydrolase/transferase [Myxococcota bacterium]
MRALLQLIVVLALGLGWLGLALPTASAGSGDLRAKVVRHATPPTLCPGEATRVPITLLNVGDEAWSAELEDRLAYHWRDAAGTDVVYDGARSELPSRVAPGQSVTFDARLIAPDTSGALTLSWSMVREGVRWVPTANGRASVTVVESDEPPMALAVEDGPPLGDVVGGGSFEVEVEVHNRGCVAWSPSTADNLSYHWYSMDGALVEFEGARTALPAVGPGDTATVTATVRSPDAPGRYRLRWAMVREGLGWVELEDAEAAPQAIDVGDPPLSWAWAPVDTLPSLHAGGVATVAVSVTNVGTEAWRPEAGDRFGYRWLDADGVPVPEEGVRTELPAIVAPGETIVLAARVVAPAEPGSYALAWEPVREHVRWYGPPQSGPVSIPVTVNQARLAFSVVDIEDPGPVWVGRERSLSVTVRNDGADAWSESTADHLSYRWLDPTGEVVDEGMRTVLPKDVAPGASTTLKMRLRGPPRPGPFVLQVEMVREHVAWFGAPRTGNAKVSAAASRIAVGLSVAFAFLTVGLVAFRRKHLDEGPPGIAVKLWTFDRVMIPLWTTAAVALIGEVFVELGGVALWEGSAKVAWSCAACSGLGVALLPSRAQRFAAAAAVVFATALVIADLAYLDFFGSIVPLTAVAAIHHLGDAHGTVSSLLSTEHWWLAGGIAAALVLVVSFGPRARAPARSLALRVRMVVVLLAVLSVTPAVRRLDKSLKGRLGARVFSQFNNVGRFGLFGAHLFELARQIRDALDAPKPPSGADRDALEAFYADRAQRRAQGTAVTGASKGDNLVILQVEALSSWARGLVIDGQAVTPYLDAAAADDAWLSMSVFDQTAQGRTSDAEYLVLSSGHPLAEGALSFRHDDNAFFTLAHVLQAQGYASLSAHPYSRGFWNRAVLHPRYGFDDSIFRRELGPGPVVGWGLSDGAFLARMVEPIAALPEPWVTFMITLSLHHPYDDFPDAMEELQLGALGDTAVGNYLQAMRHFDTAFGTFMGELQARGLADHTVVAIYGDHVTGIESRKRVWSLAGWKAWSPDLPTRIRRVPLMIWAPGVAKPTLDPGQVHGQIDIGATVMDLLGVVAPPATVGVSIAAGGAPRPVVLPNGSAVAVDRIYVGGGRDIPREGACFDLPSGTTRPLADCDDLEAAARRELSWSRAVVEHDLHRAVGTKSR